MSQKLRDLIRPAVGTNAAANFGEKYLSPASPINLSFVPDTDNRRALLLESQATYCLGAPAPTSGTATGWECNIYSFPFAGAPVWYEARLVGASGTSNGTLMEGDPLLRQALKMTDPTSGIANADPINQSATQYRINAKSVTITRSDVQRSEIIS